jgi:hypothetical protein
MLRDEATGSPALHAALEKFDMGDETLLSVKQFQSLSPDSFIWLLECSERMYYLYAGDFVESLEQITDTIRLASNGTPGELVKVLRPTPFEEMSPVTANTVYEKPDDYDDKIAHYAAESGYDFVFLFRTEQLAEEYHHEF